MLSSRVPRTMGRLLATAAPNQAAVSLANLAVVVLAARMLSPGSFGLFVSVQLAVLFCVGVVNAAVLMPIMTDPTVDAAKPVAEARRLILLVGFGGLAASVVAAIVLTGDPRAAVLATGLALPGSLYWDAVRMHFQGRSSYLRLLPGDLVGAVVTVGWVATSLSLDLDPQVTLLGLGVGPWAACLVVLPPWSAQWTRWDRPWPRRVSTNLAGDYVISTGLEQLLTLLTAVFLSTEALGGLRLAQSALGPVATLGIALNYTLLPRIRDMDLSHIGKLRWAARRFGALAGLALAIGLGLMLLPVSAGQAVVGDAWATGAPVVLAVAVYAAASAFGHAPTMIMLTSGASGALLAVRVVSAPVVAVACVLVLTRGQLVLYAWTAAGLLVLITAVLFSMAAWFGPRAAKRGTGRDGG